ncbi:MAG: hypothetical protein JXA78_00235 [Anaerolineales bacterium]|nr:hypothetical protein [Anaerolineales bacterium]
MESVPVEYRDRSRILFLIGAILLAIGTVSALLGPVEVYCFYLFSEGGRFNYPGFGFGSFMFGNIACQIVGYYLIALLCIPLGYAHLRAWRWARAVSLSLIWCWLILVLRPTLKRWTKFAGKPGRNSLARIFDLKRLRINLARAVQAPAGGRRA